jgi:methyl-accepting chemotaxis protein
MYISPLTDEPTMSFAAPVTDENGRVVSIITTNLRLDSLWEIVDHVHAENIKKNLSSYAFIVNRSGYIIAHPNKDKILKENLLRDGEDARLRAMVSRMAESRTGTASYKYEGVSKVAAYAPCTGYGQYKGHGWSVGVTEPYSELLAPMKRLLAIYLHVLPDIPCNLVRIEPACSLPRQGRPCAREAAARVGRKFQPSHEGDTRTR